MTDITTQAWVEIKAPPEKVWEALTNPPSIKQWFFGVDTQTDWKVGSPIVHTGQWKGKPYKDKGKILRIEPQRVLEHDHWSDMSGLPDRPENYQRVSWELSPKAEGTELIVREENLPGAAAKRQSDESWKQVLGNLKDFVEK